MTKAELILTEAQAIAFGTALQTPLKAIARTAELSQLHGDTVASLYRVAALKEFRNVVSAEEIKALIIAAAGDGYEVAESATFKIPNEAKLEGAIRAMQKGYLLSDEAGPHFSVILGKGGVSVLIKESGHRHKLRRAGCKQVDVVAAAAGILPRPNAAGKFDMIVHGKASCVLAGEIIDVHRGEEFPIKLPCYESDGPDGHEAKARRRLLRDLWAKVSGDFEPIELSEVDDDTDAVQVQPDVKAIQQEQPKKQAPSKAEAFADQWRNELTGLGKPAAAVAAKMFEAWQQSDIDAVSQILTEDVPKVSKDDNRIFQKLSRFANAIELYIKGEAA
jgi:hypothetical protein